MRKINDRLYSWATDIDEGTIRQAEKTARLPVVAGHVSLMPDAHFGLGATVGSVIPTRGAVIPAAVGVDIGCGMIAAELAIMARHLPDSLEDLQQNMGRTIPAGLGRGNGRVLPEAEKWLSANPHTLRGTKGDLSARAAEQLGTLGSGNHFFEICLDERDVVWLVLHSGSRGVGNQLAQRHIKVAQKLEHNTGLEDRDLAYFIQSTPEFDEYISDMLWAQSYAMENRRIMMDRAIEQVARATGFWPFPHIGPFVVEQINCHHNFTAEEYHPLPDDTNEQRGRPLWITRKGAIKADVGDRGVIPGSMGTRSYIVSGLGNRDSFNSCSHGAGRRMGRKEAKRQFTEEDLAREMAGVKSWNSRNAKGLIDEIPSSYKDIDQVMTDQADLVTTDHTLHQVLNYKGV